MDKFFYFSGLVAWILIAVYGLFLVVDWIVWQYRYNYHKLIYKIRGMPIIRFRRYSLIYSEKGMEENWKEDLLRKNPTWKLRKIIFNMYFLVSKR